MKFENVPKRNSNSLVEKLKRAGHIALAIGALGVASPSVSGAEKENIDSKPEIENVEQVKASLNGAPSEIIEEMLKDALAQEFTNGIPASIRGQKVQLVFNIKIEDRPKSEYGTVNAGATLRWEVRDNKGSLVRRGAVVDVYGPAGFDVNSARAQAVSKALKNASPQIKGLFESKE